MRFIILFLFMSVTVNAQLVFKNSNSKVNGITKFIVSQNETQLYSFSDSKELLIANWNKVPINIKSKEDQNQFKMIVTKVDKEAKITYEIQYSLYRKTNKYVGYIKATFVYSDKNTTKITEDYFTI